MKMANRYTFIMILVMCLFCGFLFVSYTDAQNKKAQLPDIFNSKIEYNKFKQELIISLAGNPDVFNLTPEEFQEGGGQWEYLQGVYRRIMFQVNNNKFK